MAKFPRGVSHKTPLVKLLTKKSVSHFWHSLWNIYEYPQKLDNMEQILRGYLASPKQIYPQATLPHDKRKNATDMRFQSYQLSQNKIQIEWYAQTKWRLVKNSNMANNKIQIQSLIHWMWIVKMEEHG